MSLKNYFPASDHPSKPEFDALLDHLHSRTDFFSLISHVKSGRYYYTSPSFERLTGFTVQQFEEEGVNFFMKRVPPSEILKVIEIQAAIFKAALEPDYDQSLPHISEMPIALMNKPDASTFLLVGIFIPLSYSANGEFEFGLSIGYPKPENDEESQFINREARDLLIKVKNFYRQIYISSSRIATKHTELIEIIFDQDLSHPLTAKEKEVLLKIAKGESTKQIAAALLISENTVETHRKNMFQKFGAKNVAELIKKTSKLYWLE